MTVKSYYEHIPSMHVSYRGGARKMTIGRCLITVLKKMFTLAYADDMVLLATKEQEMI